jgi:ribosomal peptide maturation radical SAM protein 1
MKKVLLISMPFGALERQALGLSLLKAQLKNDGFHCDIRYLTFTFARLIGVENYYWIALELPHTAFAGDWTFTSSLYGSNFYNQEYIKNVLGGIWQLDPSSIERILQIQKMTGHFLDYCMKTIRWKDYVLVGFTSTFEQNIASLALAKRIKKAYPDIKIAFGGANWEGEMGLELHRCFPFVDFAFLGEGDKSFPSLIQLLLCKEINNHKYCSIPGLVYRKNGKSMLTGPSQPVLNLDKLPIPDYSDYFSELSSSTTDSFVVPTLLFESARGCWWGSKHHCLFCGLNGSALSYRAKSPGRVFQEIEQLVKLWKIDVLQAVDNVVSMDYFKDLFPALSQHKLSYRFFYEIRANLNRGQVKILRDAGVTHVQPGIESLNDHILNLMNKGTTSLQNIQVLKWCKEYSIQADWNLLYGFPGEFEEDYHQLFEVLPKVRFLGAPTACGPVRLDRFSPYFEKQKTFGLTDVRPILPYKDLYPFDKKIIYKIAYYFDYNYAPNSHISKLSTDLINYVIEWQRNPEKGSLECIEHSDGMLYVTDTRSNAVRPKTIFKGIDKEVYLFCDQVHSLDLICEHLNQKFPNIALSKTQVYNFLSTLVNCSYMVTNGNNFLSLALWTKQDIER